jgi:hypothetical protein
VSGIEVMGDAAASIQSAGVQALPD